MLHGGDFCMSQKSFIERMKFADLNDLVCKKQVVATVEQIKTYFRKQLGALIWTLQTRFDVGYLVTTLATSAPYVGRDIKLISDMIRLVNRIMKILKSTIVEIRYGPFFRDKRVVTETDLFSLRLFSFTDAGFASLRDRKSIETAIFLFGKEVRRDGSIQCIGSPIDFYSRKIGRCVRSTISAESVAAANGIEVVLWLHSVIYEIVTGKIVDGRPNTEDTFPLCTPFKQAEVINECSGGCNFHVNVERFLKDEKAVLQCVFHGTTISGGSIYEKMKPTVIKEEGVNWDPVGSGVQDLHGFGKTPQILSETDESDTNPSSYGPDREEKQSVLMQEGIVESDRNPSTKSMNEVVSTNPFRKPELHSRLAEEPVLTKALIPHPEQVQISCLTDLKIIGLCDCANVFAAVSNWQPRSQDKLTMISLSFIRDHLQIVNFSFLDAYHNISDAGSKDGGNSFLFYRLVNTRKFIISFAGRKQIKEWKLAAKTEQVSTDPASSAQPMTKSLETVDSR